MMPRLAILTAVVLAAILAASASASASAQPGTPDPTFGSGGTVTRSFGDTSRANGISVAPGAELVAGGGYAPSGALWGSAGRRPKTLRKATPPGLRRRIGRRLRDPLRAVPAPGADRVDHVHRGDVAQIASVTASVECPSASRITLIGVRSRASSEA